MSAEGALAVRIWAVGSRTVKLTVQRLKPGTVMQAVSEWSPTEPTRLSAEEWAQYRAGRNHALATIAAEFGITVAVLEA